MNDRAFNEDNIKVLIVDDQPQNRRLIARYVKDEGADCIECDSGHSALKIAKEERPSLILLDLAMPDMDGFEVCSSLKNDPDTINIPVIFITCKNDQDDIVKAFEYGAVDYVVKPFKPKELVARMRTHLTLRVAGEILQNKNRELEALNSELIQSRKMIYDDAGKLLALNQRMADSEEKFSKAFDLNPSLMAIVSASDNKFIDANESFLRILGYSKKEVVGSGLFDLEIFKEKKIYTEITERLSAEGSVRNMDVSVLTKKRKALNCLLNSEIININFAECILIVLQDITERRAAVEELRRLNKELEDRVEERTELLQSEIEIRKKTESALRMSEKLKTAILSGLKGVLIEYIDPEMNIIWSNSPEFIEIEDVKMPCDGCLLDHDGICPGCTVPASLASGESMEGEIDLPDGRSFLTVSNPITDAGNKVVSVVQAAYEITDLKNAQKAVEHAKEQAEEVSRFKSVLLSNLKHELRTPLNGILGFSEILYDELKKPEFKNMANLIKLSGQRLLNTIESIMHLSKVESNLVKLKLEKIHLPQFIKFQTSKFLHAADEKKLELECLIKIDEIFVDADKYLLIQSLNYLLDNALKFTHKGFVRVEIDQIERDERKYAVIRVIDSGIGIDAGKMSRIFDDFYQAEESYSRQYEGSGLGLTLAKKMIELMNGFLEVESTPGVGSTFTVGYPAAELN